MNSRGRQRRVLTVLQGVSFLALALLAPEVDPYFESRPGGALPLPARWPVHGAAVLLALAGVGLLGTVLRGRVVSATPALVLAGLAFVSLPLVTPFQSAAVHGVATGLTAGVLLSVALLHVARGSARGRRVARGLGLLVVLLVFEGLATTIARTHAVGYTLASRVWYGRHWEPINALGYRDGEHEDDGRVRVFVLGDSFVAGIGIEDPGERLTGRLQDELSAASWTNVRVHNLGFNGSDTRDEAWRLEQHPLAPPEVLVLVYYVNDILMAAEERGLVPPAPTPYGDLPAPLGWLVQRSYLLDGLYWRLPHADLSGLAQTLDRAFADPLVVRAHEEDLRDLVEGAQRRGSAVFIVAYPRLTDPGGSDALLAPIRRVARRTGAPLIDLGVLLAGEDPADLVVHANDAHPNEWLQGRVGQWLFDAIMESRVLFEDRLREDATVDP